MQTAETLMQIVEDKVAKNEPISPSYYAEMAIRVNAMAGEVDNKIAHIEAELNHIQAEYLKQDMANNKALILAKSQIDYKELLRLRALRKRISDFIINSRKRSMINEI